MKDFAPNYYNKFHCIADKCKHNCCIGWEVDIDDLTLEKYKSLGGALGDKIRENISEEEVSFFAMRENGRCPFLCDDNLCEIIKTHGDEMLCDICREHPRFYNFFTDRTEWGLGLCCEEAARIIISESEPFSLELIADNGENEENDDFENYVIFIRDECIKILGEENPLSENIETLLFFCEAQLPDLGGERLYSLFSSLERLDEKWNDSLLKLRESEKTDIINDEKYALWFKNLAVYFVYRQISAAVYDARISERAALCVVSVEIIARLCQSVINEKGKLELADICEIARALSAELEYSQENTDYLLENL